jgi:protein TonB
MKTRTLLFMFACSIALNATADAAGAEDGEEFEVPTSKAVPLKMPAPEYPDELRAQQVHGIVVLVATIDENGAVEKVVVRKAADDKLAACAQAAVRKWRFKPAEKDGRAIRSRFVVPLKFSLDE